MSRRRINSWTIEEAALLCDTVAKYPHNLQHAFRYLSEDKGEGLINRSFNAIQQAWYSKQINNPTVYNEKQRRVELPISGRNARFALLSKKGRREMTTVPFRKNVPYEEDSIIPSFSWVRQFIDKITSYKRLWRR